MVATLTHVCPTLPALICLCIRCSKQNTITILPSTRGLSFYLTYPLFCAIWLAYVMLALFLKKRKKEGGVVSFFFFSVLIFFSFLRFVCLLFFISSFLLHVYCGCHSQTRLVMRSERRGKEKKKAKGRERREGSRETSCFPTV